MVKNSLSRCVSVLTAKDKFIRNGKSRKIQSSRHPKSTPKKMNRRKSFWTSRNDSSSYTHSYKRFK